MRRPLAGASCFAGRGKFVLTFELPALHLRMSITFAKVQGLYGSRHSDETTVHLEEMSSLRSDARSRTVTASFLRCHHADGGGGGARALRAGGGGGRRAQRGAAGQEHAAGLSGCRLGEARFGRCRVCRQGCFPVSVW